MASNEFIKVTLEHYKQQKKAKLDELRALDMVIRQLQMDLGETPEPSEFVSGNLPTEIKPLAQPPSGPYKPRADEFFSLSQPEAAKAYLVKIGYAVSIEDILKGITAGGCKVGGADPKRTLSIILTQNKREFVSTGGGNFGLRQFYPNMPKLGRRPEDSTPGKKAKRAKKKSALHKPKLKANTVKPKVPDPAEVRAAVSAVLSDHKAMSGDEVVAAVERRVGHPVKKIAVYGTLRKKDFEQVGEKYRMRQVSEEPQVIQ